MKSFNPAWQGIAVGLGLSLSSAWMFNGIGHAEWRLPFLAGFVVGAVLLLLMVTRTPKTYVTRAEANAYLASRQPIDLSDMPFTEADRRSAERHAALLDSYQHTSADELLGDLHVLIQLAAYKVHIQNLGLKDVRAQR